MGIYIKGMEMPKEKKITLTLFPDGRVYANHGERLWGNGKDCIPWKAVPVPPHGRLIDADKLFEKVYKAWGTEYDVGECNWFMNMINEAPTIIPASGD